MRTEILKALNINRFFKIIKLTEHNVTYSLEKPTQILMQNIYSSWIKSIYLKSSKSFPVYLNKITDTNKLPADANTLPFGLIKSYQFNYQKVYNHNFDDFRPLESSCLNFRITLPKRDFMQYFIQWQRYRKFWWSSITTTPSLFSIDDIKYGDGTADVNIVSKFPFGNQTVETIKINSNKKSIQDTLNLQCTTSLEGALFILLLDGLVNNLKEDYLRLHRKMAPFKFSFAVEYKDPEIQRKLQDLATLLHLKLANNKISSLLPNFNLAVDLQIKENLQMGVTYTAVLSESVLTNGIFNLLNSSTMLKEQIHVADLDSYSKLISGK